VSRPRLGRRLARHVAVAAAAGVLLAGCGDLAGQVGALGGQDDASSAPTRKAAGKPRKSDRSTTGSTPSAEVSLPPGDPGLDAPSVPDPGTAGAEDHAHGEGRRTVPVEAMLTAADVRMVLGGGWERRAGGGDECVVPEAALARRSMAYGGTAAGVVVETVASYPDPDEADAAVLALREAAERCGWTDVRDPRLGSAAVAAEDGDRSLTAVSTEGVLVTMVGTGKVAEGWRWSSLVDLAVGTSCPAAPDGCH
jgi:hypothetical protein